MDNPAEIWKTLMGAQAANLDPRLAQLKAQGMQVQNQTAQAELPYAGEHARLGNENLLATIANTKANTGHTGVLTDEEKFGFGRKKAALEGFLNSPENANEPSLEPYRQLLKSQTAGMAQPSVQTPAPILGAVMQQPGQAAQAPAQPPGVLDLLKRKNALAELSSDDPLGTRAKNQYDLALKQEQEQDLKSAAKDMQTVLAMPGGSKEEARARQNATAMLQTKYPQLVGTPGFDKMIAEANPKNTDIIFNPMMIQGRDIPSLRAKSTNDAKIYSQSVSFLNAAEADYANYLKNPNAPGSRVDQQGIIDKYTAISIGKPTTEAQVELATRFPGIENWFDLASGRMKTGQIIPKEAADEMMRNMRLTVINYGSTLKQRNEGTRTAADLGEFDPRRVINIPDEQITADSTRFANAPIGALPNAKPMEVGETKAHPNGVTVKRIK